jgi:acyl-CoA thioester hydrolase
VSEIEPGFEWPVRVYWEDTDAGGVVYYANYLKFLERARSEWLRSLGVEQNELAQRDNVVFVVRRVEADYLLPARFNDELSVASRLESLGRASLEMTQRIHRREELILEARVKVACVSCRDFRPAKIPAHIYERF